MKKTLLLLTALLLLPACGPAPSFVRHPAISDTLDTGQLVATAQALSDSTMTRASFMVTFTPVPASEVWPLVDVPSLGLSLRVPEELPGPQEVDDHTVFFGSRDGASPRGITLMRRASEDLLDSQGNPMITAKNEGNPVAVLQAAVNDTMTSTQTEVTIAVPPTLIEGIPYPAAQGRIELPALSMQIGYAVLQPEAETWVAVIFQGSPDDITTWMEPLMRSITPLGTAPAEITPSLAPTVEPTAAPPDPASPQEAIGVDFAVPENWFADVTTNPGERPISVELRPQDAAQERLIGLVRATGTELAGIIPDFPVGETDLLSALSAFTRAMIASSNRGFSEGSYEEITLGTLSGAWTQLLSSTQTQNLYIFTVGADDWLLVGAQAPRDDFETFSQNELSAFLESLAIRAGGGVALGLDFMIPEGWTLEPVQDEMITAQAVRLGPSGEDPDQRTIVLARGGAAGFAGVNLPPDESDPVAALIPVVEFFRQTSSFDGGEVQSILFNSLPGAYAALRNDAIEMRIYLLKPGEDDWVLVLGGATAESFNQFSREYFADVLGSLRPTETSESAAPTAIPATPVPTEAPTEAAIPALPQDALGIDFSVPEGWTARVSDDSDERPVSVEIRPSDTSQDRMIGLARGSGTAFANVIPNFPAEESDPLVALPTIARALIATNNQGFNEGRYNEIAIGTLTGAWTQMRSETHAMRLYLFPVGAGDWLLIGARATRDDFSTFGQNELRAVLDSLAVRASSGVALGLDFAVPEGWGLAPTTDELLTAEAVRLSPEAEDPGQRAIVLARGSATGFAAMGLPADETDPVAALASVVEFVRQEAGFGGGRVEPFQLDTLPGAFASLRNDTTAMRIYLFRLGVDDWLMVVAGASRDAFNAFSRAELRAVLGSLRPAATGGTLTIQPIGPIEEVIVTHVSDGDTIYVMLNGREESVRIIGMDTPEAHHPDYGAEWLGYAATHFTGQYITEGSTVWLESDVRDRDDYQRLLRYVWIKDADGNWIMLEAELIRAGLAHVRTYDEDRYVSYFHALEREAQAARLGVWGDPPVPPVEPVAIDQQRVWAINPDGDTIPMLFDAAALGNVPDPVAIWPNHVSAVVEDVYYVYPEDIDPATGQPVSEDKVGYWYWLEINDFRGWVPEAWILTEEPEWTYPAPDTDIINYSEPFVLGDEPLEVVTEAGGDEVVGTLEPGSRVPVDGLGIDPMTGDWWMRVDTQGVDGWVPLARLSHLRPAS